MAAKMISNEVEARGLVSARLWKTLVKPPRRPDSS